MASFEITQLYSVRLDYNAEYEILKKIEDHAFKISRNGIETETFTGNAACEPYITATSESFNLLNEFATEMITFIENNGGVIT